MSGLVLVRDVRFQQHINPELHPESSDRLKAIDKALDETSLISQVRQFSPRFASEDELATVHRAYYIERLQQESQKANKGTCPVQLDGDTFMGRQSYEIAKLAAGAGLIALESVMTRGSGHGFVAVRPPGHHALADRPMGFCLFNNIAVAARYAQTKLGFKRICIIDWDAHHGNGTQDLFYDDPSVLFISLHQYPLWPPNSGWYTADGIKDGKGFNVNIPLPAETGDRGYLKAWDELIQPICNEYKPDLILLSAGYDAHERDPLGQQQISTVGYALLSGKLLQLASVHGARAVGFLEGGYNTQALADSVVVTVGVLNLQSPGDVLKMLLPGSEGLVLGEAGPITQDGSPRLVDDRVDEVRRHFSAYWTSLR